MGILDNFTQWAQSPQSQPAADGLLAAGLGILANNHGLNSGLPAIGQGGLAGLQQYQTSKQLQQDQQLRNMQLLGQSINNAKALQLYQFAMQGMGAPAASQGAQQAPVASGSTQAAQAQPVPSPQVSSAPMGAGGVPSMPSAVASPSQGAPSPVPAAQSASTNPFSPGAQMNPLGIPETVARMTFLQNPADYMKNAVMPAYKPADIVSQLRAAGIDPNTTLGRQIAQQSIAKANYIAPTSLRPGAGALLPDGSIITTPAAPPSGFQNIQGADGHWYQVPVQGGLQASFQAAQAHAGGKGSVTPAQYYDPRVGGMVNSNQTYVATGGQMGGAPGQGAPSGPLLAAPPIGGANVANDAAQRYSGLVSAAASVPNAINGYDRALDALSRTTSGKGANELFDVAGVMNTLGVPVGKDEATNYQSLQKYLANAASQAASASGYTGSDARFEAFTHGQPNAQTMNPQALADAIRYVRSQQLGVLSKNNAAGRFLAQNGNNYSLLPQFETQWTNAYNPDVMYLRSLPQAEQQSWFQALPKVQQQQIMHSYQGMAALGAF